ncbi:hypothetical protein RDI58_000622 [Solanum bulbocastanum]|uniref:Uncharacterized protein n=1 Tax=Solanum bulbocastanum TaxID=147425 RepID=A0AAN8U6I5_SOLBU
MELLSENTRKTPLAPIYHL